MGLVFMLLIVQLKIVQIDGKEASYADYIKLISVPLTDSPANDPIFSSETSSEESSSSSNTSESSSEDSSSSSSSTTDSSGAVTVSVAAALVAWALVAVVA